MKVSGTLGFSGNSKINFRIATENPAIARLVFKLLKEHFEIHSRLFVKKSNSLKKNNIYLVMISHEMGAKELLKEVGVLGEENDMISLEYGILEKLILEWYGKRSENANDGKWVDEKNSHLSVLYPLQSYAMKGGIPRKDVR